MRVRIIYTEWAILLTYPNTPAQEDKLGKTIMENSRISPRSPKNRFRIEVNTKKAIPGLGSVTSFGLMTLEGYQEHPLYIDATRRADSYGGADIVIKENKLTYPDGDWVIVKKVEI